MKLGLPLIQLEETDSTNEEILRRFHQGDGEGLTVIARRQTAGRGRQNRTWHTSGHQSLAMSVLLQPDISPDDAPKLGIIAGVAIQEALSHFAPDTRIKWPNDLLIHGKKVSGILLQMIADRHALKAVVLGIGINLHTPENGWPEDIRDTAIALSEVSGETVARQHITTLVLEKLDLCYNQFLHHGFQDFRERWKIHHAHKNKMVKVRQGDHWVRGIAKGLNPHGHLIIHNETGDHTIIAGDVEILKA